LRMEAGLSPAQLRAFLGRSTRTLERWRRVGVPHWARALLQLRAGYLDALGWPGWRIVNGELYAPDLAHGFRIADLYQAFWHRHLLKAMGVLS